MEGEKTPLSPLRGWLISALSPTAYAAGLYS
jgi:hypothetical protein